MNRCIAITLKLRRCTFNTENENKKCNIHQITKLTINSGTIESKYNNEDRCHMMICSGIRCPNKIKEAFSKLCSVHSKGMNTLYICSKCNKEFISSYISAGSICLECYKIQRNELQETWKESKLKKVVNKKQKNKRGVTLFLNKMIAMFTDRVNANIAKLIVKFYLNQRQVAILNE